MQKEMYELPAFNTFTLTWDGDLCSLAFSGIEQIKIVSIEQIAPLKWVITCNE